MRLGVLLGFLIGAAIASLLASTEPGGTGGSRRNAVLEKLKQGTDEARSAARQASEERQAEVMRDWEQSRHGHPGS